MHGCGSDNDDRAQVARSAHRRTLCAPQRQCRRGAGAPYVHSYTTAFSPTDTMPLTPAAKALMTVQSLVSLLTIALAAARAVNILS